MRATVVGAGIGGLAAAIRLAAAGHDVVVLERNPTVGGKVATLAEGGYTFDLGPTRITLPEVFDELLVLAGTSLADEIDLVRLDPQCRYQWPNGSVLAIPDDATATPTVVDALVPGGGAEWERFAAHAARVWDETQRTHLSGPTGVVGAGGLSRLRAPLDLVRLDGHRTLAKSAAAHFADPRLRQLVGRSATDVGSSPYLAPATLAGLAHVEQAHGCWHVRGGIGRLRDALERAARSVGVDVRLGADVGRIVVEGGRVASVELADGGVEPSDLVVSNVDAAHLYTDLLPWPSEAKQLDKAKRSASAFVVCAAVRGRTDGISHHNVFFGLHDEQEHRYLAAGRPAIDPTVYACVPSVTDRSMSPSDGETWTMHVSMPPATGVDRKLMTAAVLNRLAERGFDLRSRIEFTRTLVPADFDARYRAVDGAIYGTSSNGRAAALSRPSNVGPIAGLYLVGGSSHPGGGLAMVAIGARIVADLVADRHA